VWLSGNVAEARAVLDGILADRIRFEPDGEHRQYRLTLPLAYDRILATVVPEFGNLQRNDGVPNGIRP
jgi:hypothetical protein